MEEWGTGGGQGVEDALDTALWFVGELGETGCRIS
jgi:hypothetical protein